ncbi:hypothetical protein LX36DRAFT_451593 [Colletotrichum falcatum]|nr:hypothetical protein LX36DRAFT_451593 [Colletotrichum falcatum]
MSLPASQPLITTIRTREAPPHFPIRALDRSIVARALARLGLAGCPGLLALRFANPHICEYSPRSSPSSPLASPCLALPCLAVPCFALLLSLLCFASLPTSPHLTSHHHLSPKGRHSPFSFSPTCRSSYSFRFLLRFSCLVV